jgi:hypothetical protein
MSNLVDTQGSYLKRGDAASPEVFTTVPGVTSIDPIPIATGKPLRDRTDLSHTDARQHKFGLSDMPEITAEGFFDPNDAQHAGLIADYNAGTVRSFRVGIPTSPVTEYEFTALVMVQIGVPLDDDVPMTITLKPQSTLSEV